MRTAEFLPRWPASVIWATAQVDLRFLCHLAPDSRKCLASGNPKITFFFFKTAIKHVYILFLESTDG